MSYGHKAGVRYSASPPEPIHVQGPYCMRRPTLEAIITDHAQAPWTLEAFTTYCEQNLCLENLEFTMDARRYERLYRETTAQVSDADSPIDRREGSELLLEAWHELLRTYIVSRSPKEVNLPGNIRESLASASVTDSPPPPRLLQPAMAKIYELMQDSILQPFLNDMAQLNPRISGEIDANDDMQEGKRLSRSTPQNNALASTLLSSSYPAHHFNRRPPTSSPSPALTPKSESSMSRPKSLVAAKESYSSGNSSGTDTAILEDTSSLGSPTTTLATSTPPNTPPLSETSRRLSPRSRSDAAWTKMSRKFGFYKKRHGSETKDDYVFEE